MFTVVGVVCAALKLIEFATTIHKTEHFKLRGEKGMEQPNIFPLTLGVLALRKGK
jgi:hypothetical protein